MSCKPQSEFIQSCLSNCIMQVWLFRQVQFHLFWWKRLL